MGFLQHPDGSVPHLVEADAYAPVGVPLHDVKGFFCENLSPLITARLAFSLTTAWTLLGSFIRNGLPSVILRRVSLGKLT